MHVYGFDELFRAYADCPNATLRQKALDERQVEEERRSESKNLKIEHLESELLAVSKEKLALERQIKQAKERASTAEFNHLLDKEKLKKLRL